MSHHLDSPLARQDVRLDITDLYVFDGEFGTAIVINVCNSIAGDIPVPGFHPEGMYEFKVDLNGDAVEDLTYRFTFGERDTNGHQAFTLRRITGREATDRNAQGTVIAEGVTDDTVESTGLDVWAGKAGDPFWIDATVLHAAGHAVQDGAVIALADWDDSKAENLFAGQTVYSIVLELPNSELSPASAHHPIGVWAVASLATDAGGWRPINRIGLPMIHPLFAQNDEDLGDRLNAGGPADDLSLYGETVIGEIGRIVDAYGTSSDPGAYAQRVARRLLPNVLPYEVGTSASFDFLGWNGRTMTDNVADVMFSIATNHPVSTSLGKESVTRLPRGTFPYVPTV